LREISRSNKTVVIVSHNNGVIRNLCDRVVWIENGHTQGAGPTDAVLEQYQQAHTTAVTSDSQAPGKAALVAGDMQSQA